MLVTLTACGPNKVRAVAGSVSAGADAFEQEVAASIKSGEINETDGARVAQWAHEVGLSARVLQLTADGWGAMSPAQKRAAVLRFISEVTEAQNRLDAGGAPVFKSEKVRARFAAVEKYLRLARELLGIVEASLPPAVS
jgi:hypothetical protein